MPRLMVYFIYCSLPCVFMFCIRTDGIRYGKNDECDRMTAENVHNYNEGNLNIMIKQRICADCGETFMGNINSKYCQECKQKRRKLIDAQKYKRKSEGTIRTLGSLDHCLSCGKEYIVLSGIQKYCPECSKEVVKVQKRNSERRIRIKGKEA